jgi:hypothetical protein
MGYELDARGSIPGNGMRFFLFHSVQTGSGGHQTSNALNPGGKATGREAECPPPFNAEVKNDGDIPPFTLTCSWHGA